MANLSILLAELVEPSGLFAKLFTWFSSFVSNYGWAIVLLTIAVKLITSPLDFYNRYSTKKNTLIRKRLDPQVKKITQKFQNNQAEANRQVSLLYKKEGYNMIGSCVFMLINLVITSVIFFSFFNTLREISSYKMLNQYQNLEQTYYTTLNETGSISAAEDKTLELYLDFQEENSWLWVKNIWRNDSKVNSVPSYEDLVTVAEKSKEKSHKEYISSISEEQYNAVTKSIQSENAEWNGYFLIAVLVALTSFLSQYIAEKQQNTKNKKDTNIDPNQKSMEMLKYILPLIILLFVLTNTASFGIYILIGNIFGILINFLFGFLVKLLTQKEEEKYLAFLEKESIKTVKKEQRPRMVTYKNLGDRLWTQLKYQAKP